MPETFHDKEFGRLEWDATLMCWLGGINWPPGLHTEVAVWFPGGDKGTGIAQAHRSLEWLRAHEEQARMAVAGAMAEIYNDAWTVESEPLSVPEFARRIELVRIAFEDDGSLILSYDGRDLFGGHVIDGTFKADRSFGGATLVG